MSMATVAQTTILPNHHPRFYRGTALLLIIEALLIFAPLAILGAAIDWPTSLSAPASVNLPLIHERAGAVTLGYGIYLVYSILFWPVILLQARAIALGSPFSSLLQIAVGFGAISTFARTLGILRWLFPQQFLASIYVDPSTNAQTKEAIAIIYGVLNEYAGMIGEFLGVNLFAATTVLLLAIAILQVKHLPKWLGIFGLVAAVGLYGALVELVGIDFGPFTSVTVTILHFWWLAFAGVLLLRKAR